MMIEKGSSALPQSTGPRIFLVRNREVMLDEDLAAVYEVETEALCRLVARSINLFPENAVFQLSAEEVADLKLQLANSDREPSYVFTGPGLAMLSSMLLQEHEALEGAEGCAPTCGCRS